MKRLISEDSDRRLDVFLTQELGLPRNQVKKLFTQHQVLVNEVVVKPSYKLKEGDYLTVDQTIEPFKLVPMNLNLEIVYEDEAILVLNKPSGLLIHPSISNQSESVVNHLLYHTTQLSDLGGSERPGIVHRLDQDTSGLLVIAKTNEAHIHLVNQFKERQVKKVYECITYGPFKEDKGSIIAPITRDSSHIKMAVSPQGKEAITHFKVLNQTSDYAHLEVEIVTGRTHQIRVHLSYINHPIVGDGLYGAKDKSGQLLHATTLGFYHPITNEWMTFTQALPPYFKARLTDLNLS